MRCQDFERQWNELLDTKEGVSAERERALEAHAASCEACRRVARRYQALRLAINSLGPPPAAPAGFADRCLSAWDRAPESDPRPVVVRARMLLVPLAAAAAIFLAAYLGTKSGWFSPPRHAPEVVVRPEAAPVAPLTLALAEATSATFELAREASAPAARIGRELIEEAAVTDAPFLPGAPASLAEAASKSSAAEALQRLGGRVHEGVRPLSGSARHAFSFLMVPSSGGRSVPSAL